MQSKTITSLILVALAACISANASTASQCGPGKLQCCQSVQSANTNPAALLIELLGIVASSNTIVGVTCTPVSAVGVGANSCTAQLVCCENDAYNGLIAIGCTPVTP